MNRVNPLPSVATLGFAIRAALASGTCVAATLGGTALADGSVLGGLGAGAVATAFAALVAHSHKRRLDQQLDALRAVSAEMLNREGSAQDGETLSIAPPADVDAALVHLEGELRAIARAYRNLEVERERAQGVLERQSENEAAFFARLSHELRSPLNAVLGYTSLLIDDAVDTNNDSLVRDLARIRTAGQELLTLIENLLDLSDERAGRHGAERAPFDLADVFSELVAEYSQRGHGSPVSIVADGGQQTLFGNRKKVHRTIASLFDDALRARGMHTISLSSELAPRAEQMVRIRMRASQPAGASIPLPNRGSDVGLQAAQALASALGGRLELDESDDQTVIYTLHLPLDSRLKKLTIMHQNDPTEPTLPLDEHQQRGVQTALIIDDDPAAADLLGRWLVRSGYSVISATDAEAGLALALSRLPDVILLDALMPGTTGYDVLPKMRAHPQLAATPILIVTVDDDRNRGLDAGASDYIRKPISEADLRRLIATYETDQSGDVLIIDDDDDAADLLVRNVRRMGFTTRRAGDGAEGLAALKQGTPRAILLDLNMPNLNGFEFIKQLSRDTRFAAVPLIVVSGQDLSVEQHTTLLSAGCKFYLKGNATPREIAAGLREALA